MRKPIMVTVPAGSYWPDMKQASGAQSINVPFNWVRIEHRSLGNTDPVILDFDNFIVDDDTLYWEKLWPGDRRVRNIAGPEKDDTWPTRIYFRNLDAVNDAHLMLEVADTPIVDLNNPQTPIPTQVVANKKGTLNTVSVATSATQLDTAPSARKAVTVTNPATNANKIYIGFTNAVTNSGGGSPGIVVPPGNTWTRSIGPGIRLWAAADTGATSVTVDELS